MSFGDPISDCAKGLKDLQKLKMTYPTDSEESKQMFINLKA